jgi:hypothetical protein
MMASLLWDKSLEVEVLKQFGLDLQPSLVLYSALTKMCLHSVSPEVGVVNCLEGQKVKFWVNVACGLGKLLYRWYKHALSLLGKLEKCLLDCNMYKLQLTVVDINNSGFYLFSVTTSKGMQVQPELPLWELCVWLVCDFDELNGWERWYKWLDEMVLWP